MTPENKETQAPPVLSSTETWSEEARQIAAQCWCDDETKHLEMDAVLSEAVAKRLAPWMDAAARAERAAQYYRDLVVRCGQALGEPAFTADDGGKSEDVLCAKVPELVEKLMETRAPVPSHSRVFQLLNEAYEADPAAIHALVCNRVPCNERLATTPVQTEKNKVTPKPSRYVTAIGLLNGLLAPTQQRLTTHWVADHDGNPRLSGFEIVKMEK